MLIKEKVHFEKSIQFLEKIANLSGINEDTVKKDHLQPIFATSVREQFHRK